MKLRLAEADIGLREAWKSSRLESIKRGIGDELVET